MKMKLYPADIDVQCGEVLPSGQRCKANNRWRCRCGYGRCGWHRGDGRCPTCEAGKAKTKEGGR